MAMHKIRKGLALPLAGTPEQCIQPAAAARQVALLGMDAPDMKR